ncbi:MAG: DUF4860 domain-containing protein [Oscillospiraceae bacterium]|jgi:hypothetical protein|nr:DUF4860 domain-containing protein [Oscillospiraceae bacterium]
MRKPAQIRHMTDILFTLSLFCVLAASALLVVITGARVYRGITAQMDKNFMTGTSLTYISNKIRQNDESGAVYVGDVEGKPALVLERSFEGGSYETWIFYDGGALKEVMVPAGTRVTPGLGQQVVEVSGFVMEQIRSDLFRFTATDEEGGSASLTVGLRTQSGSPAA